MFLLSQNEGVIPLTVPALDGGAVSELHPLHPALSTVAAQTC